MSKEEDGSVSPMGEILNDPSFSLSVLCVSDLDKQVIIPQAKKSIHKILLSQSQTSRFSSIVTRDEKGVLNWEKTEVNVDDHVFVPHFPPNLSLYDKHVEEYISDLHLSKLDPSRPLWEYHFINYKTTKGEATAILKLDHMLGDGTSLLYLTKAFSTTPHNDHTPIPSPSQQTPITTTHTYSQTETTTWACFEFISRIWNGLFTHMLVMWYTLHDLIISLLRSKWMEDSRFSIRGHPGVELLPKVMASCTFTLQDIGEVKKCVDGSAEEIHRESQIGATKGNKFGLVYLRVPMKKLKNPLEYVQRAKHMFDKKKMSLAAFLIGIVLHYVTQFKGAQTSAKALYNAVANSTIVVTNVNGPTEQMMFEGYKVRGGFFSVSGLPTNILVTCYSYMGNLRMQVIATKGYVDANKLSMCFQEAFIDIKDASNKHL